MNKQKIIIVNEKNEIIWTKERDKIISEDIYRASWIMISNSKWEFLLAQRWFNKKNDPWHWSMSVAWTIEEGETYDDNITKEIEEEIWIKDLQVEKLRKVRINWKHNYFLQLYKAQLDKNIDNFTIQKEEVEKIRWFTREEILIWEFEWYIISKSIIDHLDLF